jgi:hypothetical protein
MFVLTAPRLGLSVALLPVGEEGEAPPEPRGVTTLGQEPEQRAIPEAVCVDVSIASKSFWTSPSTNAGVLPFGPRIPLNLDFQAGFMGRIPFSVSQENSMRMAAICCATVGGVA